MNPEREKWILLIVLTLIWGSSFILIKKGLEHFDPYQVGALRVLIAGVLLSPLAIIPAKKNKMVGFGGLFRKLHPDVSFSYCGNADQQQCCRNHQFHDAYFRDYCGWIILEICNYGKTDLGSQHQFFGCVSADVGFAGRNRNQVFSNHFIVDCYLSLRHKYDYGKSQAE